MVRNYFFNLKRGKFLEEASLTRAKRQAEVDEDNVQCDEGDLEYDGICYTNSEENQELISELSQFDSPLLRGGRGGPGSWFNISPLFYFLKITLLNQKSAITCEKALSKTDASGLKAAQFRRGENAKWKADEAGALRSENEQLRLPLLAGLSPN